jgi:acyl phosphate:glycerol-3-phosphate acyltransferase
VLTVIIFHGVAFLIGSIPIGYLIGRAKGLDVRQHGSGNVGATNIGRLLGKKAGVVTFLGDLLKGSVGVSLSYIALLMASPEGYIPALGASLGFCTILGHCYSPFLKFKGGKGVATSLGVFLMLAPVQAILATCVFALVFWFSRYVSVGSMSCAVAFPIFVLLSPVASYNLGLVIAAILAGSLIIFRHKTNISRLRAGTEPRFSFHKDA